MEREFLATSRQLLVADFLPRIQIAVRRLDEQDLWWRPNEESNSVGNLLLHLAGNVRQWIVSGVGGAEDNRRRQEEFDRREPIPREELLTLLAAAVHDAAEVIDRVRSERLLEELTVQGRRVTVLEAIYHVVEHFAMHTGQIVYVTKMRTGGDLGFYQLVDGIPKATWRQTVVQPEQGID